MGTTENKFNLEENFPLTAKSLMNAITHIDIEMTKDVQATNNLSEKERIDLIGEFVTRKHDISYESKSYTLEIQFSINMNDTKKEEEESEGGK